MNFGISCRVWLLTSCALQLLSLLLMLIFTVLLVLCRVDSFGPHAELQITCLCLVAIFISMQCMLCFSVKITTCWFASGISSSLESLPDSLLRASWDSVFFALGMPVHNCHCHQSRYLSLLCFSIWHLIHPCPSPSHHRLLNPPTGFLQCFDAVGWVIWPIKTRPRWWDVKPCSVSTGRTLWTYRLAFWIFLLNDFFASVYFLFWCFTVGQAGCCSLAFHRMLKLAYRIVSCCLFV